MELLLLPYPPIKFANQVPISSMACVRQSHKDAIKPKPMLLTSSTAQVVTHALCHLNSHKSVLQVPSAYNQRTAWVTHSALKYHSVASKNKPVKKHSRCAHTDSTAQIPQSHLLNAHQALSPHPQRCALITLNARQSPPKRQP